MKALKPYDLVTVDHGSYRAYAEIISHPITASRTIMVRTVPSEPTTMIELPMEQIQGEPIKRPKQLYVQYAKVCGVGSFPVDMLRYDFASPLNFTIVMDGRGRITTPLKEGVDPEEGLIIARLTGRKLPWTYARWSSFLWSCEEIKSELFEQR